MTIEERIESLERDLSRVRRLNRWGGVLMLMALGAAVVGIVQQPSTKPGAIRTTELQVVDVTGETRARLGMVMGAPSLSMQDTNGTIRVTLRADKEGTRLSLMNNEGYGRAFVGVDEDGHPSLLMYGESGKVRAAMNAAKDGPTLSMADESGGVRALMNVSKKGVPYLWMADENGKIRTLLDVGDEGPALSMRDENGKSRATLGAATTVSQDGTKQTCPESTLLLYGLDGKILWKAP